MPDPRAEATLRIVESLDDTRVLGVLRRYEIDPTQEPSDVQKHVDALSGTVFDRLQEDYLRVMQEDLIEEVTLEVKDKAAELWKSRVKEIDERSSYLRNVMIPKALALHDEGNMTAFGEMSKEIEAESISIVSAVHQDRLQVREDLRQHAHSQAPYLHRNDRHAIVNEIASADDLLRTALYAPPSAQQAAQATAQFRRTVQARDMERESDIDIRMAARKSSDPSPGM